MTEYMPVAIRCGDNLALLRNTGEDAVDLIYLDPPFNTGRTHKTEAGEFRDRFTKADYIQEDLDALKECNPALPEWLEAARTIHGESMACYLTWLGVRLSEMRRVLKPTGSLWLHCDPTASHYCKQLMDAVMGRENILSEIIWKRSTSSGGRISAPFPVKVHDVILSYATKKGEHTYNRQYTPYSKERIKWFDKKDGDGRKYQSRSGDRKQYLDESPGVPLSSIWDDLPALTSCYRTAGGEYVGYPTQKPEALLERIILASSNPGDLVMDPFCGSGTTLAVATKNGREAIGMDESEDAVRIAQERIDQILLGELI